MAIERSYRTPGPLVLDLRIPSGWIEIETVDGDETSVVLTADDPEALERASVQLNERGEGHELVVEAERRRGLLFGALDITIDLGGLSRSNRFQLTVRCPHGADARVATPSADLKAPGRLGSLEVKTASGNLVAGEVAGDASVKTASGQVELDRVGGDARVQTVSGEVSLRRVGGDLTIQTVSGDVRVEDAARSVRAKTVSGDQRLAAVEAGDVSLTSVSGDVEVGIRRGSQVHVDATSISGLMSSELELSDEPEGAADGPLVDLRAKTVSGDVRVLRAAARA